MPFKKGQSGNPGGRPKLNHDIQELARTHTDAAISALVLALSDVRTRVAAAVALLDRGYGKPIQTVNAETTVHYVARIPHKAPDTAAWQKQHIPPQAKTTIQ